MKNTQPLGTQFEVRMMPNCKETEIVVLGTLVSRINTLCDVQELLDETCFYVPLHQEIYKAIVAIDSRGDNCDLLMLVAELTRMGKTPDLYEISRISSNFTHDLYQHASRLAELALRRRLILIAVSLNNDAHDLTKDVELAINPATEALENIFAREVSHLFSLDDAIRGVVKQIERNHDSEGELSGMPTGFSELDKRNGGLQPSDLIVIAGETGQGKTSFAMCMAWHAAVNGNPVAVYSLEMRKEQIAARLLATKSGLPVSKILYGQLTTEEFEKFDMGAGTLMPLPIWFDDRSTSNIDTIIKSIRILVKKHGIRQVNIDYIQIANVNMPTQNKESQMGEICRRLKNLAKELNIAIVIISQLNRDKTRSSIDRLRDSGQISEAADIIMTVNRYPEGHQYEDPYEDVDPTRTAMIKVVKGRNIGTFNFIAGFDASTTRFHEPANLPKTGDKPMADGDPF